MNVERLKSYRHPVVEQDYTWKDTILYALGLGCGVGAANNEDLRFVYEGGLQILPSMSLVLGMPKFWLQDPEVDVDWVKVLHGEQRFTIHRPLQPNGRVRTETRALGVDDKGTRGAVLYEQRDLFDRDDGAKLATLHSTVFMRGDGGGGGFGETLQPPGPVPADAPDAVLDIPTAVDQALLYRLSGDLNPLHADFAVARAAGFDRPILHGLGTMGVATRAVLALCCDNDPRRLKDMFVRFTSPVFPGETLRTECYRDGPIARFRTKAVERNVVVLDRGQAVIG